MGPAEAAVRQRLIVVCGPGGVGKTTTAAALGLQAARRGRKALVLTIDPARRLGEALGLEGLGNDPTRVPADHLMPATGRPGELFALMLDQRQALTRLIERVAANELAARRVLDNRVYTFLSTALSTSEYAAVDRLHDLYDRREFDLYVLDTPPSANALDFLDSPDWAARFLDRRIIRWFLQTARRDHEGIPAVVVHRTARVVSDLLGRVVGREFYNELSDFFGDIAVMADELRGHAERIKEVLRHPTSTFFVVTAPERGEVDEAVALARALRERGFDFGGFVVNRVEPSSGAVRPELLERYAREAGAADPDLRSLAAGLAAVWRDQSAVRARDEEALARLSRASGRSEILHLVGRLGDDVKGLDDLARFADSLAGS